MHSKSLKHLTEEYMFPFKTKKPLAVLIHGCHVDANEWKNIIIGDDLFHGKIGRATLGVEKALTLQASCIIWGTGASECDGKKESQIIF